MTCEVDVKRPFESFEYRRLRTFMTPDRLLNETLRAHLEGRALSDVMATALKASIGQLVREMSTEESTQVDPDPKIEEK